MKITAVTVILTFAIIGSPCPRVAAHDVPIDQIGHHIQIVMSKDRIVVDYTIVQSELADVKEMIAMNTDGDYEISQTEKESYFGKKKKLISSSLELRIDGNDAVLNDLEMDVSSPQLRTFKFVSSVPGDTGPTHEVSLYNNIPLTRAERFKYYIAPDDGITVTKEQRWQKEGDEMPADQDMTMEKRGLLIAYTTEKLNKSPVSPTAGSDEIEGMKGTEIGDRLRRMIKEPNLSFKFVIVALLVSAFLGGLHALTPGHGKAVVAAYLVGTRGRTRDAVLLGLVVTFTHTSSVILLGVITLFASEYILPQELFPWLGVTSGLLIMMVGGWLLVRNLKRIYGAQEDGHTHSHGIFGKHSHGEDHGSHSHNEEHTHNDDADHEHTHVPGKKSDVTLWSLLSLGISGGIIPCPDALVVLLIALALHRIGFGLLIIAAFSVGLAVVLVTIGILMVLAKPIIDRFTGKSRILQKLPVISAVVVIILGLAIASRFLISSGIITINI